MALRAQRFCRPLFDMQEGAGVWLREISIDTTCNLVALPQDQCFSSPPGVCFNHEYCRHSWRVMRWPYTTTNLDNELVVLFHSSNWAVFEKDDERRGS